MAADYLEIIMVLRNIRQFVAGADQASAAIAKTGTAAEQSGKKAGMGWKGLAKWAGGAAALYGATRFVKSAVGATEDLAKQTLALQRTTGMDTETASKWSSVAKERGIQTKSLQVGFVKLSKAIDSARTGSQSATKLNQALAAQYKLIEEKGGKKAPAALAKLAAQMQKNDARGQKSRAVLTDLGVSMADISKGDTSDVILQVADALSKMKNPAERAATAQKLLGRSGQQLMPLLLGGRKGIEEQLAIQKKYGNYISGKSLKDTKTLIERQREMKSAYSGVKVQLGEALLPVMLALSKILVQLVRVMQPFLRQGWAVKTLIGVLVFAFLALKGAMVAAQLAELGLNASMLANPVFLVVAAIIALGVALFIAYKKIGWFHNAVDAMWHALVWGFNWLKQNWPLLLGILTGPFGLAAVLIIKHFGAIKTFALGVIDAIKQKLSDLINWVDKLPSKLGGILKKIPGAGLAAKGLKALADGGVVRSSGMALVGERGPELVSLPAAATVTPLPGGPGMVGSFGQPLEITVPVIIDRREIARAVARYASDKKARK